MEQLVIGASILITNGIVQWAKPKKPKKLTKAQKSKRKNILRTLGAIVSIAGIIAGHLLLGIEIDVQSLQGAVELVLESGFVFFGAQGTYYLKKN